MVAALAFRGRWLVGHVVVLAVAALFVRFGMWQLDRLEQVRDRNTLVEARRSMPVAPLPTLLSAEAPTPRAAAQRRVVVEGRYDPGAEVLVPFRSLEGRPGSFVLTPLVVEGGGAVLVNRGWVAPTDASALPPAARPPSGPVLVTGLALPGEPGPGRVTQRAEGRVVGVTRVDLPLLEREGRHDLYPVHVQLLSQVPRQGRLPVPVPPAPLEEGPHLSYAVQWFTFATIGLLGWPLVVRRAAREGGGGGGSRWPEGGAGKVSPGPR